MILSLWSEYYEVYHQYYDHKYQIRSQRRASPPLPQNVCIGRKNGRFRVQEVCK